MLLGSNHTIKLFGESKCLDYKDYLMNKFSEKIYKLAAFYHTASLPAIDVYLFFDEKKYDSFVKDKFTNIEGYTKAANNDNQIAILCDEEKLVNKPFHYANVFAHMYSHVLLKSLYPDVHMRHLWLDEGIAQLVSDEKNGLLNEDVFRKFLTNKIFNKDVPLISFLKNHNKFNSKEYNGYAVSYLLVRFLQKYGDIFSLIKDEESINNIEKSLISRVYNYYGSYMQLPGWQIDIKDIKDPVDLYNYLNLYITHGWIDNDGNRHEHTLEGIKDNYRVNSIPLVLQSKLATCIEQTMLEQRILDNLGYETRLFCDREFALDKPYKVKMHFFCAFKDGNNWCYFEHAKINKRGIHYFTDYDSLISDYLYNTSKKRVLTEIPDIPEGITISALNEYINNFPIIKRKGSSDENNFVIKR